MQEQAQTKHHDFYIFGHRHLPLYLAHENALYVNTGDWLQYYTFARFDTEKLELLQWADNQVSSYHGH